MSRTVEVDIGVDTQPEGAIAEVFVTINPSAKLTLSFGPFPEDILAFALEHWFGTALIKHATAGFDGTRLRVGSPDEDDNSAAALAHAISARLNRVADELDAAIRASVRH